MSLLAITALALAHRDAFDASTDWNSVASAIRGRYYARVTNKAKMDSLLAQYEPIAKAAPNLTAFEDVVNKMIKDFGDSHFALLTKSDQGYYLMDGLLSGFGGGNGMAMPSFGAWFKTASEGYTVQMVIDGTAAMKSDLRKGDVILKVNDQPFSPVDSISSLVGKPANLEVRRGSEILHKTVDVSSGPAMDIFLGGSRDSARIISTAGRKYGYFHLWTQGNDAFKNALANAVSGKLRETDGFILDLRDGFGGRPEGFADPFFRPDVTLDWGQGTFIQHESFGYGRPLVVLINKGSRSAKEVLSYILKKSKRAVLIGSNTAGDVLGTSPMKLGDWGYIEIPMVDLVVDGHRLEKVGVAPDIAVAQEFDSEGKDLYIAEAVKYLDAHPRAPQN